MTEVINVTNNSVRDHYFRPFGNFPLNEKITSISTIEDPRRIIVVTGTARGQVKLWNLGDENALLGERVFHSDASRSRPSVDALGTFKFENTVVIVAGGKCFDHQQNKEIGKLVLWKLDERRNFSAPEEILFSEGIVHCLTVCKYTGRIAVATGDRKISVYTLKGVKLLEIVNAADTHTDLILSLAILPSSDSENDKFNIVSVGWDKRMVVWDQSGNNICAFEKGHNKKVTVAFVHKPSGEGTSMAPILLTGSLDKTVCVWDFDSKQKIRVLVGHTGQINAIQVCDLKNDGCPPIVLTASEDRTIKLWDLLTGFCFRTVESVEPLRTLRIIASEEGIIAISSGTSPNLLIWNLCGTLCNKTIETGAVTSIDVHTSPDGNNAKILIGSVDKIFYIFDQNSQQLTKRAIHLKRINAGIIVPQEIPLVVSADGNAEIKIWELNNATIRKELTGHQEVVLTVAVYDRTLFGKTRNSQLQRTKTNGARIDVTVTCVLSGGRDRSIKIWDLNHPTRTLINEIPNAHEADVRSIVVYHPQDANEAPKFVSGSYDRTAKLWNLETLTQLQVFRFHTDFLFFTAIYDPRTHYNPAAPDLTREKVVPAVITSSYDRSFAVWDMDDGTRRTQVTNAHNDSITALAIYSPAYESDDEPLIITGSIDQRIHVRNLFSGEKIRTLVGHNDRVCWIYTYYPPNSNRPIILSGGDDGKTILWKDSLQQKSFMPLRMSVASAFEADLETSDWPLITEMTEKYGASIFFENSNLFTKAVLKLRGDFLFKFWDPLTLTLPTIKSGQGPDGKQYDILSLAIVCCDLDSVRAIVLAWIKILNQDMDNMLTQRVYHASYFFPHVALELLSESYPSEFVKFIKSLRLVQNYSYLMQGRRKKILESSFRSEFQGSTSRENYYDSFWENFRLLNVISLSAKKPWLFGFLIYFDVKILQTIQYIERFFQLKIKEQPVTSMMVPFKNCDNVYEYLKMFVAVSNQLDDVSIFNSEVAIVFLRYFWHIRGRGTHVLAFSKYVIFFMLVLLCIYTYEMHYPDNREIIILSYLCILGFVYYGVEELWQMKLMRGSITLENAIIHFSDLWNAVDISLVVNGILGLILRLAYDRDTPTGRGFLAVTSVLMWFKILYFLRPFSISGPLVAMILRIASEIRVYLVVLFCVLAGYAQAFWMLSNNDASLEFGTVQQSFLNSFLYMLGQNISGDFGGAASPFVAQVLLICFLLTMMILMLNLLIALMGDVFSKVRAEGIALWRKEQASIIIEEKFIDGSSADIPPHLLVLKYTSDVTSSSINFKKELEQAILESSSPPFTQLKSNIKNEADEGDDELIN